MRYYEYDVVLQRHLSPTQWSMLLSEASAAPLCCEAGKAARRTIAEQPHVQRAIEAAAIGNGNGCSALTHLHFLVDYLESIL